MVNAEGKLARPVLEIRLMGAFRLTYGGEVVTGFHSARLQSLLAYLALHVNAPQSRRSLAYLFWPESEESQAHSNLRKLIVQLRHALPEANTFVHFGHHTLQWNANSPYVLDVANLDHLLKQVELSTQDAGTLTTITELYRGDLLPNCYDDWIVSLRRQYQQRFQKVLERHISLLENQRAFAEGIGYAQRLLEMDPLDETHYQRLMRLRSLKGDRSGALRVYQECVTILQRELGVEPSMATQQAYTWVLTNQVMLSTSEVDPLPEKGTVPLVGRQLEWQMLCRTWQATHQSRSQMLLISGEAGIGKTRLAEEFLSWSAHQGVLTARTHAYGTQGTLVYAPVTELLREAPLVAKWDTLSEVHLVELSRLLPELIERKPNLRRPEPMRDAWQRQQFIAALARAALGNRQPRVLLLDDLHWWESESLAWLDYLLTTNRDVRLLVIGTIRIGESTESHPLNLLLHNLRRTDQLVEVELGPLSVEETADLAAQFVGAALAPSQLAQLYGSTEGNPLFIVETLRSQIGAASPDLSGMPPSSHELRAIATLPPKIASVIQARLAKLSSQTQEVIRLAATIGRSFTYAVLAAASHQNEDELLQSLDELWGRHIVREQGENAYDFSHDHIRAVVYATTSRTRRRQLHRQVAKALEQVYEHDVERIAGEVAAHYESADLTAQALPYYHKAAEASYQFSAYHEAEKYLTKGLALLQTMPQLTSQPRRELEMQTLLGKTIAAVQGVTSARAHQAFERALALTHQLDDASQLPDILVGLRRYHFMRREPYIALDYADQLMQLAEPTRKEALTLVAHHAMGVCMMDVGQFEQARIHLEKAIAASDPRKSRHLALQYGQDPRTDCLRNLAHVLWHLGYPDQARRCAEEAVALARQLGHPSSLLSAFGLTAKVHTRCGDYAEACRQLREMMALATEAQMPGWIDSATGHLGCTLAAQGAFAESIPYLVQGIAKYTEIGARAAMYDWLAVLGYAYIGSQQLELGLSTLKEAHKLVEAGGVECKMGVVGHTIGEALLLANQPEEAEHYLYQALEVSRRHRMRSYQLRAAISLGRLWQQYGESAKAKQQLSEIYSSFTEGFETEDLKRAQTLLDQLL